MLVKAVLSRCRQAWELVKLVEVRCRYSVVMVPLAALCRCEVATALDLMAGPFGCSVVAASSVVAICRLRQLMPHLVVTAEV